MIDTTVYDARKAQAEADRLQRVERARIKRAMGAPPDGNHGASAYSNYGCRCPICKKGWREIRHRNGVQPSALTRENEQLRAELDAAEMHIDALRQEIAMLYCRLDELEVTP